MINKKKRRKKSKSKILAILTKASKKQGFFVGIRDISNYISSPYWTCSATERLNLTLV